MRGHRATMRSGISTAMDGPPTAIATNAAAVKKAEVSKDS